MSTPASPSGGARRPRSRARLVAAGWAGLVSGALGLGVAHLLAQLVDPQASPVIAVGGAAIDATPNWLKDWAIRQFGTGDKHVLLSGVVVTAALLAVAIGIIAGGRFRWAAAAVGALGLVAVTAELSRAGARWYYPLPTAVGLVVAVSMLHRLLAVHRTDREGPGEQSLPSRRGFLALSIAAAVGSLAAIGIGNALSKAKEVARARLAIRLPSPTGPAPPSPTGINPDVPGLSSYLTPSTRFYRVDTALVLPQVDPGSWRLRIDGMVAHPVSLSMADILAMPLIERDITMTCVSNEVGGPYVSTARWLGLPLRALMDLAGVSPDAEQLFSTSTDGFTTSTPVTVALDGRDAMIAVGMNGQPLPVAHGFPARMIVPGLYGYVSGCKWISSITATTYAAKQAYWTQRGWDINGPIYTESRIDVPSEASPVKAGVVPVAGVAWAQHRGISKVEVSIDDGPWQPTSLSEAGGDDTWRQWWYRWNAAPGSHSIRVRATDRTGSVQTDRRQAPFPRGATGIQEVIVNVS
ncbi:MAG TPA: molybdopterin-dependent oxidoreductase [Jatrophihabitans sp.]|nr:molybdopterin-dependent oxidoreductase [Jatrophihabitans sp.]